MPLLVMFTAGAITTKIGMAELVVIAVSFADLFCSFYAIKFYSKKMVGNSAYQLVVLKVIE